MGALPCSLCEEEIAGMMQTNLDTGDTIQVGASCMVGFMLASTAAILPEVSPDILALYTEQFDSIAASNPSQSKPPVKAAGRKSPKDSTAASADDAHAADDDDDDDDDQDWTDFGEDDSDELNRILADDALDGRPADAAP